MRKDPIAGYFNTAKPQYKYSGGPVMNLGNMNLDFLNDIDWTQFDPATGTFKDQPAPVVEEVVEPEVQYESVKQYETKPQGFRYQEGKTPFEMVQREVVPPVEAPVEVPVEAPVEATVSATSAASLPRWGPRQGSQGGYGQPQQPYTTYPGGTVTFGNTNAPTGGK